jgi:hypothetical protein
MRAIAKLNPDDIKLIEQTEQQFKSKGQNVVLIAYDN